MQTTPTTQGVERLDIGIETYHTPETGVGHSMLEVFRQCRLTYHAHYVAQTHSREATDALRLGSGLNIKVLEPHRWATDVVRFSETTTTKSKAFKDFAARRPGKVCLTADQYATVLEMEKAIKANPLTRDLIYGPGPTEVTLTMRHSTGRQVKVRLDKWPTRPRPMIVDLKSTCDIGQEAFDKSVLTYGYHRQMALYRSVLAVHLGVHPEAIACLWVPVSNEWPYVAEACPCDPESLDIGHADNEEDLAALAECDRTNNWNNPGHGTLRPAGVPAWAKRQARNRY